MNTQASVAHWSINHTEQPCGFFGVVFCTYTPHQLLYRYRLKVIVEVLLTQLGCAGSLQASLLVFNQFIGCQTAILKLAPRVYRNKRKRFLPFLSFQPVGYERWGSFVVFVYVPFIPK